MELPGGFDAVLHPPARLQITAVLANVDTAEFARLKAITGASDSVMSKHLAALVEAGYVKLSKAATDGRQRTWVSLTRAGRTAFSGHVAALEALVSGLGDAAERAGASIK